MSRKNLLLTYTEIAKQAHTAMVILLFHWSVVLHVVQWFRFLLVFSGSLVTQWYTGSGQWYSPILRGGMTYSGGYITVSKDGLYYIYAQLHYNPQSGQTWCGFYLYLNKRVVDYVYAQNQSPNGNQHGSRYTGLMKIVNKGDTLSVKLRGPCYYYFSTSYSQFGAFRVD